MCNSATQWRTTCLGQCSSDWRLHFVRSISLHLDAVPYMGRAVHACCILCWKIKVQSISFHKIIPQDIQTLESKRCKRTDHANQRRYSTAHRKYKKSKVPWQKQGIEKAALKNLRKSCHTHLRVGVNFFTYQENSCRVTCIACVGDRAHEGVNINIGCGFLNDTIRENGER